MPFDALAVHAIRDEIEAAVVGGRVQKTHFADEQTLVLEIYAHGQRRWLLASARRTSACAIATAAAATPKAATMVRRVRTEAGIRAFESSDSSRRSGTGLG